MKRIPLTQGKESLVDDCDCEYLMQWKWCYARRKTGGYAARQWTHAGCETLMHRIVARRMGWVRETDHCNQDKLDNRRSNLRPATRQQNTGNCKLRATNHSGFKGVSAYRTNQRWRARITVNNKDQHLGYFPFTRAGKIAAACAYNEAALKYFGNFACFNKV